MRGCFLPTLSDIVALGEFSQDESGFGQNQTPPLFEEAELDPWTARGQRRQQDLELLHRLRTEREWQGAVSALSHLLHRSLSTQSNAPKTADAASRGVVLSGPIPVLDDLDLAERFSTWVFTPQSPDTLIPFTPQLQPAETVAAAHKNSPTHTLPLIPGDPLAGERFCLVLTSTFSLILVLGEDATGRPRFLFSFTPEVIQQVWELLRSRVMLACPKQLDTLEQRVQQFAPIAPDYRLVANFGRLLLSCLPESRPAESTRVEYSTRDRGCAASQSQNQVTFLTYNPPLGQTTSAQSASDQVPSKSPHPAQPPTAAAKANGDAAAGEDAKPPKSPQFGRPTSTGDGA